MDTLQNAIESWLEDGDENRLMKIEAKLRRVLAQAKYEGGSSLNNELEIWLKLLHLLPNGGKEEILRHLLMLFKHDEISMYFVIQIILKLYFLLFFLPCASLLLSCFPLYDIFLQNNYHVFPCTHFPLSPLYTVDHSSQITTQHKNG